MQDSSVQLGSPVTLLIGDIARVGLGSHIPHYATNHPYGTVTKRPTGIPVWIPWRGAIIVAAWHCATIFVRIPKQEMLNKYGFDELLIQRLIRSNWLRTAAWSIRAIACGIILLIAK